MSSGVTVEIIGLKELQGKLRDPKLVGEPLHQMLTHAALTAERHARMGAPRDTGALSRSIVSEVRPLQARIKTPLTYAPAMESGRRPGARMPPPGALTGWARRHGFAPGMEFVIARAIRRRGIKGRFFMKKARDKVVNDMPSLLRRMASEIERRWGKR